MEQGWIKLHRSLINHWIWADSKKLKWWLDLLLMANHKENKLNMGNALIEIPRGGLHTSVTKLANRWQVDKKTVRKFLNLLQSDSMITYSTSSKGATIILCNYNKYQANTSSEAHENSSTSSHFKSTEVEYIPQPSPLKIDCDVDNPSTPLIPRLNPTLDTTTLDNKRDSKWDNIKDNQRDSCVDNQRDNCVDNKRDNQRDNKRDNQHHSNRDNTMDTNNNVNNAKNLKNAEKGEEGKKYKEPLTLPEAKASCEDSPPALSALAFSTPHHRQIFNSLGEVTYRTWFMDATIEATPKDATLRVDSDFKLNIINSKFRVQLGRILGKRVQVTLG